MLTEYYDEGTYANPMTRGLGYSGEWIYSSKGKKRNKTAKRLHSCHEIPRNSILNTFPEDVKDTVGSQSLAHELLEKLEILFFRNLSVFKDQDDSFLKNESCKILEDHDHISTEETRLVIKN